MEHISDNITQETREMTVIIGSHIAAIISKIESRKERLQQYIKCRGYLTYVSLNITGKLYRQIRDLEYELCDVEPTQAPKGWKCAICMSSLNSHLCEKTLCDHYFHIGCTRHLVSPSCPLCRDFM